MAIKTVTFILFSLIFNSLLGQEKIEKVEIFTHKLKAERPISMSFDEISQDIFFFNESNSSIFINTLSSFLSDLKEKKIEKFSRFNKDYRILVVLIYNDGTVGYIAGNSSPYIIFNNKVYKDKGHNFLILLNAYFDIPDVNLYLKQNSLIK